MKRRLFLKTAVLVPFAGLLPVTRSGTRKMTEVSDAVSGHFWMQIYGPHYDPSDIEPGWKSIYCGLIGIYSGSVIKGCKASNQHIGDRLAMPDGRRYMCFELSPRVYRKKMGIYLKPLRKVGA